MSLICQTQIIRILLIFNQILLNTSVSFNAVLLLLSSIMPLFIPCPIKILPVSTQFSFFSLNPLHNCLLHGTIYLIYFFMGGKDAHVMV
jgi:hypothetical protein